MSHANHVMIDIETLDTTATAVVLSIGALRFDGETWSDPGPDDEFEMVLGINRQLAQGRTVNDATFRWWMRQGKTARLSIAGEDVTAYLPEYVLEQLFEFIPDIPEGIWGNGSDFDNAILQHLASQNDVKLWPFWANRCFRTFTNLHDPQKQLRPQANDHNALSDCWNQYYWMQNICAELGVEL